MLVPTSDAWKLVLAIALAAMIFFGVCGAAPARRARPSELRWLVVVALGLYAGGTIASFGHRTTVAALVYAAGVGTCAFALWLSRGTDWGDDPPRGGEDPSDERPPPEPDGLPAFDWAAFERGFRSYSERSGESRSRTPALR